MNRTTAHTRSVVSALRGTVRTAGSLGLLCGVLCGLLCPAPALAATETVSLERLGVEDVILLPTISSQYISHFTLPRTWKVSPSSHVEVNFQHAMQLLPENSWLQIFINDHQVKHIPLTRANVDNTRVSIPLPISILKDDNTLTFRVQQHYAHQCEDPLDKSLWTQILPATKIVFDYQQVAPTVNLLNYPYPLIDPLTYSPAKIRYVLPGAGANASDNMLQSLTLINVNLAQKAGKHEVQTRLTPTDNAGPPEEHLVYVATALELASLNGWKGIGGDYTIQGGRWVHANGQPLGDDQGIILFAAGGSQHARLVVSGNNDKAVLQAARYLSMSPRADGLHGASIAVPSGWMPLDAHSTKVPRYIENSTRTFQQLEIPTQEVHKINAPPIIYKIPVVTNFRKGDGRLWLDLSYGYGPGMNPTFSSLELRMNNISLANIPLMEPAGENMRRVSIPIANELIRPKNELVAQFHMMPDKYGWCVDNYVDHAWGKIYDDSGLRVEGRPASALPDTALLGAAMFPYSREDNLENVKILMPANPDVSLLDAMLGWTTRLGRATLADTDLRLSVGRDANVGNTQNVMAFRHSGETLTLPNGAKLTWSGAGRKLTLSNPAGGNISSEMGGGSGSPYLETYALDGNRVLSVLTAPAASDFRTAANWLESDKAFAKLEEEGWLNQVTPVAGFSTPNLNSVGDTRYHQEGIVAPSGGHSGWFGWFWNAIDAVGNFFRYIIGFLPGPWHRG